VPACHKGDSKGKQLEIWQIQAFTGIQSPANPEADKIAQDKGLHQRQKHLRV
jgi:hypothetical protein